MPTKIEWATEIWNPVTGCSKVSPGCDHCYADEPFKVTIHPDRLAQPMHWRKPRRVFVCSMGDIFHDDVDFEDINIVFNTMALCPQHTFFVLTKRPERALEWFRWVSGSAPYDLAPIMDNWPLPSVFFGVTAEDQQQADERIPLLLQIPAAVRFVSCEPLLSSVDLQPWIPRLATKIKPCIDWVIAGAETGPGARPMYWMWARRLRDQCNQAAVPFFFKKDSSGQRTLDGVIHDEYPSINGLTLETETSE